MHYMYSVFIEYMYTCTESFPNFLNLSLVNGGGGHNCENM